MKLVTTEKSFPLVLYFYHDDLIDKNGKKIGMGIAGSKTNFQYEYPSIFGLVGDYQIYDLDSTSSASLRDSQWAQINPETVYNSVQNWYKNEK